MMEAYVAHYRDKNNELVTRLFRASHINHVVGCILVEDPSRATRYYSVSALIGDFELEQLA